MITLKILESHCSCQPYCFIDGLCTCLMPLTNPYIFFSLKTDRRLGRVAEMHFRTTVFCTWSTSCLADQWREWFPSGCFWVDPNTNFGDCWHNTEVVAPSVQKVWCPSLQKEANVFPMHTFLGLYIFSVNLIVVPVLISLLSRFFLIMSV